MSDIFFLIFFAVIISLLNFNLNSNKKIASYFTPTFSSFIHSSYRNLPTHFHQHYNDDFSLYSRSHETIFNGMKKILLSKIFSTKRRRKKLPSRRREAKEDEYMCVHRAQWKILLFHCGNEKWWGENIFANIELAIQKCG